MGTVTVRFMMDDLRADNDGFPYKTDIIAVTEYLDIMRPVAVKDFFVVAPIPQRVDVHIVDLTPDNSSIRAGVEENLRQMLRTYGVPGARRFMRLGNTMQS